MADDDILYRARKAMEGITEGPWEFLTETVLGYGYSTLWSAATRREVLVTGGRNDGDSPITWMGEEMTAEDRAFIEAAPALVRDLLAECERLRQHSENAPNG